MAIPATSMREVRLDAMRYRWRQLNSSVDLSKVQSVDQRMRLGMRCRLSPTADVPSHTSGADSCTAANDVHEFSVLHSSSASARRISPGGISSPSTLAVLRLTTISSLVGCSTGRSAGFAPFRILST